MYTSKSGKKFGSIFAGRKHDQDHTPDGMHTEGKPMSEEHEEKETPEFEAGEQEGAKEHEAEGEEQHEGEEHEEHPVVAEHGPAHKVIIHHDEASGRHTVQSHHKDGHVHSSVHEHAHEAHKEASDLAGVPPAGKEGNEEKIGFNHKDQGQQGAPSESDGFAMPNLV